MIKALIKRGLQTFGINPPVLRYHAEVACKKTASAVLGLLTKKSLASYPPVTLFIINSNNRYPLELTLRTLRKHTSYPNYQIWVADNGSTDGSVEFLESVKDSMDLTVIRSDERKLHGEWLDYAAQHVTTPYWFGIDEDMLFLGRDWLMDLMQVFVKNPDWYLLSGDMTVPEGIITNIVEPVSGEVIDREEMASTWLFGVRRSLRDQVESSFLFHKGKRNEQTGNLICYDTSGKLLAEMREKRLRYGRMPWWFLLKHHHIGHLSWAFRVDMDEHIRAFKLHQLNDIKHRVLAGKY